MADFTLNNPGTVNNPWTPAGVIIPVGAIQSDAVGFRPTTFATSTFAHDATYGSTITATITLASNSSGDDVVVGATVRSGANAGGIEGVWFTGTNAICGTMSPAGTVTTISSVALNTPRAVNDVLSVTTVTSAGVTTITALQNGAALTFSSNTTSVYAAEASLAAGCGMLPNNSNGTKLSQFTGTGVTGGGGSQTLLAAAGIFNLVGGNSSSGIICQANVGVFTLTGKPATLQGPSGSGGKHLLTLLGVGS